MRKIVGFIALLLIAEVFIFLEVASSIGSLKTIIIAILTTALAPLALRGISGKVIDGIKESLNQKISPASQIASGIFRFISGSLLLLPGFLSDFLGLFFLLVSFKPNILAPLGLIFGFSPPTKTEGSTEAKNPEKSGQIIEGEFQNLNEDEKKQYD